MEPRIASLLGDTLLVDRTTLDQLSLQPVQIPPPSVAPRRPLPVEPRDFVDETLASKNSLESRASKPALGHEFINKDFYGAFSGPPVGSAVSNGAPLVPPREESKHKAASRHAKSTIPLTEVLNSEEGPAAFSGSLSDILLDTSPRKKRKLEGNELLTLPKPHPPAKKGARRPRIPPLLQGLHQPPPDAGLFPPITGDGFKNTLVERPAQEPKEPGPSPRAVGASEGQAQPRQNAAVEGDKRRDGKTKKRNKWTEQETKDLLRGVARFGIGNWKKILECRDYVFRDRTSVDLKDRFRTCCPDEYNKYRASDSYAPATPSKSAKGSHESGDVNAKPVHYAGLHPPQIEPWEGKAARRPRSGTDRKGPAELAEMGIDRPFFKNKRRERREFTERDDEALIRGFEKHGPVWHTIRSDPELGFSTRHPTDLRDRFRTRFPEKYAQAGYKVKPKDAQKQRDRSGRVKSNSKEPASSDQAAKSANRFETETPAGAPQSITSAPTTSDSRSKSHSLLKPLLTAFPEPFDDFPDLASEDEASYSPITLSRNIFQWADAHPPHSTNAATTNIPAIVADTTSHLNFNLLAGMDQYHINPLATLNLPSATTTSFPTNLTTTGANIPSSTTITPIYSSSSTKQMQNTIQYPPNLPTLTFLPSHSSGTRSGGINLPPPADLLSGLDLDERTDVHNSSSLWEDGMGLGMGTVPTSTAGTGAGAGSTVVPIRGLFESDGLGERSLLNSSV